MASTLHVIASTDRRGAEVFASELVEALADLGHDGGLVAVAGSSSAAPLPLPDLGGLSVGAVRELRRLARTHDRVVAHGSTTLPACAIATIGGVPFVYRSIGDPRYWSSSGWRAARVRLLLGRAATVVALWPGAADELRRRGLDGRVVVIPNAVDTSAFRPPDAAERLAAREALGLGVAEHVVLYLGSLSDEKNPGGAVEACDGLAETVLVMAGDGPRRAELAAAPRPAVRLVGAVDDARSLLWAADCLILPSRTEGIPAAAIEAGACGLPVVATDVGGVSSVVLDGRTGRLVEPGSAHDLRTGVIEALAGSFDGALARSHCVEHFDLRAVARQWDELLVSIG